MKYLRIGRPGYETPVALSDGKYYDLSGPIGDIDGEFLQRGGIGTTAGFPEIDIAGERIAPPIAKPSAIVCIGMNYAAHCAESGAEPPAEPVVFYKHPNTIVGPNDDVEIPRASTRTDWEVELGVVFKKRASYLESEEAALDCIAGFLVANDLSEREFQIERSGGQFSKGKACPTFTPLGPYLVTPDEIGDPQALRMWSKVNGEIRQDSNSKDMIFSVARIIHHMSQFMAFDPGDLLLTGTPEGVALSGRFPYLAAGDVVSVGIEGLGHTENPTVQA
ncbi:fumarylacetoacetate hydrolase family protein [Glycomyces algeriensis]|uniref:2-hydroxyhepta-2,4-diene-1,7-dioate isomerase n=1 Tax=Glycomyces algeriensis TaxID=256037 RepID=A0A9W6LEK3_9ACTN|nr:fumarylacetoacetate hydrolase family protein [Glycomyces algeriensis]MDA1368961.1 fumarylacetoacetate hydrolase family protein [Glycomyces algeriensis]MDR7353296.1 2-keto-4-pentenoate hydratase/2-oxohepta-3-ene-1,7-dioic acid hydratase in catechol pathway [Glycomyces algeriensis]GLI40992.1 2-hydroxyhepta-2,4-diene-1,7-dioate isomerase [Glycomyces algeriensis]